MVIRGTAPVPSGIRVETSPDSIPAAARAALDEERSRNLVQLLRVRSWAHALELLAFLAVALLLGERFWWLIVALGALHLAGFVALARLASGRGPSPRVLLAGIVLDHLTVDAAFVLAWATLPPARLAVLTAIIVAYFLAIQVVWLGVLGGRGLVVNAAVTTASAVLVAAAGLPLEFVGAVVALMSLVSINIVWAGRSVARLLVESSLDRWAGELDRGHRRRLERANLELVAAQDEARMLGQLIVHDLKNPLAAIVSSVAVVEEELAARGDASDLLEDLDVAHRESDRLRDMIGDLLLVNRLESDQLQPTLTNVRIRDLLARAAAASRRAAEERRVALDVAADEGLLGTLDEALVRRMLDNLVSNALRHARPGGHIELAASASGESLVMAVRNDGPPVPEALAERIFEKHATHGEREWHNVGLGLYLCRLVSERHGGRIRVVPHRAWPVSFEATFPAHPGP